MPSTRIAAPLPSGGARAAFATLGGLILATAVWWEVANAALRAVR